MRTKPRRDVVKISEARARLFELAERVRRKPGEVVIIEQRDTRERLALTTEDHLLRLELQSDVLRKQAARPFRLAGSMTSDLSDDALEATLQEARRNQDALLTDKLAELDP
jgi:hypothetical protein